MSWRTDILLPNQSQTRSKELIKIVTIDEVDGQEFKDISIPSFEST